MVNLSVIVAAFNASSTIQRLLEALDRQTYDHQKFETYIIDDGSTDDTRDIVQNFLATHQLKLKLIEMNHKGQGYARNQGIELSEGKVLAFTDADCIPDKDWLQMIYQEVIVKKHTVVSGLTYSNEMLVFPWKISPAGNRWVTANLAVQREALGDVRFRLRNSEDVDFILQLQDKSSRNAIYCVDTAKIEHPVNVLNLRKVMRFARRRVREVLLVKMYGQRVYGTMHFMYRPVLFGSFSLLFIGLILASSSPFFFGMKGFLLDIALMLLCAVLFVSHGYKAVVKSGQHGELSFNDRVKTFIYLTVYSAMYLLSRLEGSIRFRKLLI